MHSINEKIIDIFESYRMPPTSIDQYAQVGKGILTEKLQIFTSKNQPIQFAMLGLPFKSTNKRDKVLGDLPDLGEQLTIQNFENFNSQIKSVYQPGANINIASDGLVFNDLLGITDSVVQDYKLINESFRSNSTVKIIDLNDFYNGASVSNKRERLMQQFGYTWDVMEHEILFNPDINFLYRGMLKFMNEELAWQSFSSNSQREKAAKKLVREMMLRNEAYNALVRHDLKDYIRLSMHPSVNNGYKYSFKLIPGNNTRHSAWHCAIVLDKNEAITMHKRDAEAAGHQLVYKDGRPYNYVTTK